MAVQRTSRHGVGTRQSSPVPQPRNVIRSTDRLWSMRGPPLRETSPRDEVPACILASVTESFRNAEVSPPLTTASRRPTRPSLIRSGRVAASPCSPQPLQGDSVDFPAETRPLPSSRTPAPTATLEVQVKAVGRSFLRLAAPARAPAAHQQAGECCGPGRIGRLNRTGIDDHPEDHG